MSNYSYISSSSQVKVGAGKLKGIFVSAASSTPTITVYDTDAKGTSTTVVGVFTPSAATNYPFNSFDGIYLNKGLYVVLSGTVTATVIYE
ncbi:MAG: hypothetical protein ORN52_02765 [Beijerinckiaceae bacterium]|nr:hypothetical protein [Beijerinckiaceae bacterium]